MTLSDMDSATSLPELQAGRMPCASPDGRTTKKSGPGAVPVSHSAAPVREPEQMTLGIFGRSFIDSSESERLSMSLGSRCRERLGTGGSMEYRQTWKRKTTPLGRSYWAHIASARRTSDSGCGGSLVGWATPRSVDSGHSTGSPTRARDHKSRLEDQVYLAGWATPTAKDGQRGSLPPRSHDTGTPLSQQVIGVGTSSSLAPTEKRGALASAFSRWLMGFPPEWCLLAPSAKRKR